MGSKICSGYSFDFFNTNPTIFGTLKRHILKAILSVQALETSCSGGFVSLFSMIKIVTNICPWEMNVKQAL